MSGHSHWATIKRKKASNDAKKGQTLSKLMGAVYVALRFGTNPANNLSLKSAIEKAKTGGVTQDTIDRALSRAAEEKALEEVVYEVYGPSGIAILIRAYTDNNNRTFNEIKHMVSNYGKMAEPGTAKWLFEEKGVIAIAKTDFQESFVDELIGVGLEDYREDDSMKDGGPAEGGGEEVILITDPKSFFEVKTVLEKKGVKATFDELQFLPKNAVEISENDKEQLQKQIDKFLDNPDVSQVFSNIA